MTTPKITQQILLHKMYPANAPALLEHAKNKVKQQQKNGKMIMIATPQLSTFSESFENSS